MKYLFWTSSICILLTACSTQKMTVLVPPNDAVVLSYDKFDRHDVTIDNKSLQDLKVGVRSASTNKQLRGFGLSKAAKATVLVERESQLTLQNSSNQQAKVVLRINEAPPAPVNKEYISFTLQNTTASAIPLIIPNVMNPNLSPFSKSGVDLEIGQEIFFKENGKRYVLLTVDESIEDGAVLDVAKLLKTRKSELGL